MNGLRPVEKHFLHCFSKRITMKSDEAIALVIYWLHHIGLVRIDKRGKTITASVHNDHNWPFLKNYEYLALKAIATPNSAGLVAAVENYNFAVDLEKMGYLAPNRLYLLGNPCAPSYSITAKGQAEIEKMKMSPSLRFRIPAEIIVYVDISIRINSSKMISFRQINMKLS